MSLTFLTPWLLSALLGLPVLWLLLRAVPPAPIRRFFPGVILLLGLRDKTQISDRTPWWLLLIRMLALGLIILGLAGPLLNPQSTTIKRSDLLILLDGGWAAARDWQAHQLLLDRVLNQAARDGRPVAIARLTTPSTPVFQSAQSWQERLPGLAPTPWVPDASKMQTALQGLNDQPFDSLWLSDGLAQTGRAALLSALQNRGDVEVIETEQTLFALEPAKLSDGMITLHAIRLPNTMDQSVTIRAHGTDPNGRSQIISTITTAFTESATRIPVQFSLPAELRERVSRFDIVGQTSAAGVSLTGNSLLRREVALISEGADREGLELLSPLHFIAKAYAPSAELLSGDLTTLLPANPDLVVLADIAKLSTTEETALGQWVAEGGLLLRFAGPRLATSDLSRTTEHPLMPVRLRAGGRTVGGAMSWGAPKSLAAFAPNSPFFGLEIPNDVRVSAQVLAQPDPSLSQRVIAMLADGTPLVTRKQSGKGQIVLFHVTANAEWSSLPLSGLFVQMLERLSQSVAGSEPDMKSLQGTIWQPSQILSAQGQLEPATRLAGIAAEKLFDAPLSAEIRPGLYTHAKEQVARNVIGPDSRLLPAIWPNGTNLRGLSDRLETPLGGWCLILALLILLVDVLATLSLSGRLVSTVAVLCLLATLSSTGPAGAQDDGAEARTPATNGNAGAAVSEKAWQASSELTLAYVVTGNSKVDAISKAGLDGLSQTLFARTSVEPAAPVGLDLERDMLMFYPLLYWPITAGQPTPSLKAYRKLNAFLKSGGMIVFDTRDGDIAGFGTSSSNSLRLQKITYGIDIPALEPMPQDHVLTRAFYLLQDFPGRYTQRDIWVEAAPQAVEKAAGMPFRNLNDGVSPVIIGGNDWAAAWAVDAQGKQMFPIGRNASDRRQRELAYRFGINLVMHVLTGNYKSDQVHVPALLDRLGQ
ncbi:MAG TPA: LytTR family transcriptional regulator [Rhodobacteraceae bacterium]|nr:LytTR family transcriptional regulator [Paracoccaceae bacterium]